MTPVDWSGLARELNAWRDRGLELPFWWRDDDAETPTAALQRLRDLARSLSATVHLAVIPARADERLADFCRAEPNMPALVHGWSHRSHAPAGAKKSEFGPGRDVDEMLSEAKRGLARVESLFENAMLPVFVPPWNRIAAALERRLGPAGFRAVSGFSRYGAPPAPEPAGGDGGGDGPNAIARRSSRVIRADTHVDPVDWRGSRSLADPDSLLARLVGDLASWRAGRERQARDGSLSPPGGGNPPPLGLLTHHLAHDEAIWSFVEGLISNLLEGGARAVRLDETPEIGIAAEARA